jgi:hypothetical protein
MGAHFLLAIVPFPTISDKRRAALRVIINQISGKEKDQILEELLGEDLPVDEFRDLLNDHLDNYLKLDNRRDTTTVFLEDHFWIASGGLSYGDTPTDAFGTIAAISSINPVYTQLDTWAKADRDTKK